MESKQGISVIILAGGKSSRLGKDKRQISLKNKSLIEYSIALARNVSDDIIISANDYLPNFEQYKVIPDIIKGAGPLQGIISSLQQIRNQKALVLTSDMPFLSNHLISKLIQGAQKETISHFALQGQFYPFPSLIPCSMLKRIIELEKIGEKSLKRIFSSLPTKEIQIPDHIFKYAFLNVNRAEDFELAKKILEESHDL